MHRTPYEDGSMADYGEWVKTAQEVQDRRRSKTARDEEREVIAFGHLPTPGTSGKCGMCGLPTRDRTYILGHVAPKA
jgi:hypothetical protein